MTTPKDDELKPCPFCGEQPVSVHKTYGWEVACKTGECPIKPAVHRHISLIPAQIESKRMEVESLWNTRTTQPSEGERMVLQKVGFTCERTKERHTFNDMTSFTMAFLRMKKERDEAIAALTPRGGIAKCAKL